MNPSRVDFPIENVSQKNQQIKIFSTEKQKLERKIFVQKICQRFLMEKEKAPIKATSKRIA